MKVRPLLSLPLVIVPSALGCQILYDKTDLTVAAGGGGATSTTSTGGATGGTTSTGGTGGTTNTGGTTGGTGGITGGTGGITGGTGGFTGGTGGITGGTGGTTGGTGGGTISCDEPLFVVGTSSASSKVLCAPFAGGVWAPTVSTGSSSVGRPTAALVDAQNGVGVYYGGGVPGPMRHVRLANGACMAPADVPTITSRAAPATATLNGTVHMLFLGAEGVGDYHPFSRLWTPAGGWTNGGQVGKWTGGAISGIARSGTALLALHGRTSSDAPSMADSAVARTLYMNGSWGTEDCLQPGCPMPLELTKNAIPPALAAIPGGWVAVFQDYDPGTPKLRWLTFLAGASASTVVQDAGGTMYPDAGAEPPSLWPTADGAVLAYRGKNGEVVTGFYTAGTNKWSAVAMIPGVTTPASPGVAHGTCSHLVFVNGADSKVAHCAHDGAAWKCDAAPVSPEPMTGVAIAAP